jgi:light-regulated signal transduction histidine kinase (bacteriophytochrome)
MERKQREEELTRTAMELTRSNGELQQFAYVASHDLQEPLRAVAGCVQLLAQRYQGKLDGRADQFIRHAVEGAARMQTLITDLLAYSRVSTKAKSFEPTECNAVLRDVLADLTVAVRESGAQITADSLPAVTVDSTQLRQLLQNLIGNALKFRAQAPLSIHVGVTRREDAWLFSIRDNGIGIGSEYLNRIFEIFKRLHTRKEYPGNGIGLAICKKIVEQHGGQIWVESERGRGSVFYFTLAAAQAPISDAPRLVHSPPADVIRSAAN